MGRMKDAWLRSLENYVYYNGVERYMDTEDERDWNRLGYACYELRKDISEILKGSFTNKDNRFYKDIKNYMAYERKFESKYYPLYDANLVTLVNIIVKEAIEHLEAEKVKNMMERELLLKELTKNKKLL